MVISIVKVINLERFITREVKLGHLVTKECLRRKTLKQ